MTRHGAQAHTIVDYVSFPIIENPRPRNTIKEKGRVNSVLLSRCASSLPGLFAMNRAAPPGQAGIGHEIGLRVESLFPWLGTSVRPVRLEVPALGLILQIGSPVIWSRICWCTVAFSIGIRVSMRRFRFLDIQSAEEMKSFACIDGKGGHYRSR